jgi:AcrR family transcriptional regulator
MVGTKASDRRGRRRLRPDDQTRQIIYLAALCEFEANGYAATSMESVARRAGISTKTLYRIIPKADLLTGLVSDRFERFTVEFRRHVPERMDIEQGLKAALIFCADFALHPEIIGLQRMILQGTSRFPELTASFYESAVMRATTALSEWLSRQVARGLIRIDDCDEAAGAPIGMVVSAPLRAALYAGLPPPSRPQVDRRIQTCVTWFLHGCQAK